MLKSRSDISNRLPKIILLFFIILSVSISCKKKNINTNPIPEIEFLDFKAKGDSGIFTISFKDGDGDIGLKSSDTTGEFHYSKKFYHNMFFEYYEKNDYLGWQKGKNSFGDDVVFTYRIPFLEPNGSNKSLEGEIQVTLEPRYYNPSSKNSDTIKFVIYIYDRALNKSNEVETFEIVR